MDGQPHGKGMLEYKNGDTFYGNFYKGSKQGLGFWEYSNSSSILYFAGSFEGNERFGNGSLAWRNGAFHFGEYMNDEITGWGFRMWSSGIISKGMFEKGRQKGNGTDFYLNGERYDGNFVDNKRNGYGIYRCAINDGYNKNVMLLLP